LRLILPDADQKRNHRLRVRGSAEGPAAAHMVRLVTYCLAMRLNEGLLFLSDTRTNAGVDNVSTFKKLHVVRAAPDRVFVLQSAGNLGTTHELLDRIERDLAGDGESLATVGRLFEAALYVGRLSRDIATAHRATLGDDATATFILGGQIEGERPDILLIYPAGNCIRASDELPFLQIGEAKYGKALLEFAARGHVGVEAAAKVALSSMMSTARANLSVGPALRRRGVRQRVAEGGGDSDRGVVAVPRRAVRGVGEAPRRGDRQPSSDPCRTPPVVTFSARRRRAPT
jgi:putative proteasome-type protease